MDCSRPQSAVHTASLAGSGGCRQRGLGGLLGLGELLGGQLLLQRGLEVGGVGSGCEEGSVTCIGS